jgi:hypothetical protein
MPKYIVRDENRIMARAGNIVGFSKTRVVWQFGFLPESDMSNAFGVSTDGFLWVIADYSGKVLEMTGYCYALDIPERYKILIRC